MAKRRYTEDDKAMALASLMANGGNVLQTAKQLDIPVKTLQNWKTQPIGQPIGQLANDEQEIGQEKVPDPVVVVEKKPDLAILIEQKKTDLAIKFEGFVDRVLSLTTDEDIKEASLKDRFTAAGIASDKMQLLRGESTQNVKVDARVLTVETILTPRIEDACPADGGD